MRKIKVRPGLRGWMVAVAVAAGLMGWRHWEALRVEYEEEAAECEQWREIHLRDAQITHQAWLERCAEIDRINEEEPIYVGRRIWLIAPHPPELARRRAEYWGRRKARYERAARRPWLAVGPDEPEP